MIRLFYATETCALATHIALIDAAAPYELVKLHLASGEHRQPEYLAVNPKARVPALITEEGVLTETPALLAYVAQRYPQAALAPRELFQFARVQEFNSYLASTVHVAHAHRMRGERWADDPQAVLAMKKKVPANLAACFELIERDLLRGPWVMGETYTICDPYLFTLARWLEADGVDLARVPKVRAHRERMGERANVQQALAEELGNATPRAFAS